MLDLFHRRDKTVALVLKIFLALIAISMVVTLIPGFGSGGGMGSDPRSSTLAEFGDQKITVGEAITNIQNTVRNQSIPPAVIGSMIDTIVDGMVGGRVTAWHASELGMKVSDEELSASLKSSFPQLFPGGNFVGKDVYANFLQQNGTTIPEFEANFRRDILRQRLRKLAGEGIVVTDREVTEEYKSANEKIKLEYVALTSEGIEKLVNVTDDQVRKSYEQTKASLMNPQKYSYTLVILDENRTAQMMPVSDADLMKEYDKDKERFRTPERVKVRHILIKTQDKSSTEAAAAEKKAKDILAQLKAGGNFAELAKKNSEDPGSGANGGDLGFIVRGQTVPEFEKASFSLAPNQLSDLVKTQFGYHIIQPLEKQAAGIQPFDMVKDQLRAEVNKEVTYSRMMENARQLRQALLKNPGAVDEAAAKVNAMVIKQDVVAMTGMFPGLGPNPELQTTLEGMKKMTVGNEMSAQNGSVFIPILRDIHPPVQKTFEEAAGEIRQRLIRAEALKLMEAKLPETVAKAKAAGADFAQIAKEVNGEYKKTDFFARNGFAEGLGSGVAVAEAFKLPVGGVAGPIKISGRDFMVRVLERTEADLTKMAAERKDIISRLKTKKTNERGEVFDDGLLQSLIEKGKVKIYDSARQQLANFFKAATS